ncbi:MAG TPA: methionyl-tRNA formyltransferase [Bacillota bacterium]|nr:methionyl-tRNA formyltransferase [Bacillota bacterium]
MKKIVFMGTPDFSVSILEQLINCEYEIVLVVTQPDRPVGRKRTLTPPPVKKLALEHNLPVFQPENIKEQYEHILTYDPDIIVTAAYGQILPKELLENPPYKCINVHASLLPELRGGAPIHYAILQGKQETGITIMYMVEQLDAGDIISQEKIAIEETDDVGSLHDKLANLGGDLLLKTLPQIFADDIHPVKQDEQLVTYAPNITRQLEKINWEDSYEEVYNHIRGLRPWPVAYTTFNDQQMKVWWGEKDGNTYKGQPGEIVEVTDDAIVVVCGDQRAIRLKEIQPAGSRRMDVSHYLHGAKEQVKKGIILGD